MPAALLDTNAVSDLMRDHPRLKARVSTYSDPITTRAIVVGEIRHGLSRLPSGKKRTDLEARAQSVLTLLPVEPIGEPIAETYGSLKATLESQRLNLDDNDLWIAATALPNRSIVITRDRIFSKIPGLQVEDWTT